MESMIAGLMMWVVLVSGYQMPEHLPRIEYVTQEELRQMYMCEVWGECSGKVPDDLKVGALYSPDKEKIFVDEEFDVENPQEFANLVHEITHHVQRVNGRFEVMCVGLIEKEAYDMADRWLVEKGFPPKEKIATRLLAQTCWGEDAT